jgi:hypothetical protein
MPGDWQPYNGPAGGVGWHKPGAGKDGGDLIVYTASKIPPGRHTAAAPQTPVAHMGGNLHGGFQAHPQGGGEHPSVGAHRLVSALRLAGKLINRPHLVNLQSLSMLIRLFSGMNVAQLRSARSTLGKLEQSPRHGQSLRERAHLDSLATIAG